MDTEKQGRLYAALAVFPVGKAAKADVSLLLAAVAHTNAKYDEDGLEPGAEKWQADTRKYRAMMISDVMEYWAILARTDELFPWHDDYVAEIWVTFRKLLVRQKVEIWALCGVEIPTRIKEQLQAQHDIGKEAISNAVYDAAQASEPRLFP